MIVQFGQVSADYDGRCDLLLVLSAVLRAHQHHGSVGEESLSHGAAEELCGGHL